MDHIDIYCYLQHIGLRDGEDAIVQWSIADIVQGNTTADWETAQEIADAVLRLLITIKRLRPASEVV